MNVLFIFLAVLAGCTIAVQAGINAKLQVNWAQSSVLAAFISFAVGTCGLALWLLLSRTPIPALAGKTEFWHWTGGLLGAFFVTMTTLLAPRLGAVTMIALILAGQMGGALILDHFGLLGYAERHITWQRLVGAVLVGGGVFMIRRF